MLKYYKLSATVNHKDGTERQLNVEQRLNDGALEDAIIDILDDGLASSFVFTVVVEE